MRSYIARERRRRRLARLVGAEREQPRQLAGVAAQLGVPRLDRLEQRDHRLGDVALNCP